MDWHQCDDIGDLFDDVLPPFLFRAASRSVMYFGRILLCALLSLTNRQHITTTDGTMGDDLSTAFAILATEMSWKQFKLSWKSHGIVLSDFCGTSD